MSDFKDAYAAGADRQILTHAVVEGVPLIARRDQTGTTTVEFLERLLPRPTYLAGAVKIHDYASFIAYVTRFRDADSVVFADRQLLTLTAVLDYHRAAPALDATYVAGDAHRARWGRHVATYTARTTPEWATWNAQNGKKVSQLEFAEFLENNLVDVARPTGAELLEMATRLEASKSAKFAAGVRLADGQTQITYEETITGAAGEKNALTIPPSFILGIAPFEGADKYALEARFRYRIADGGKLSLWYDLLRPFRVVDDAFGAVLTATGAALGETPIIHGSAK